MKQFIKLAASAGFLAMFCSTYAQIPGDAASIGLTHIKPDTCIWYNINQLPGAPFPGYVTNGPVVLAQQFGANDGPKAGSKQWEPYTSVVGDSTFIVASGMFADDGTWQTPGPLDNNYANQRENLLFQPAAGGAPKDGEVFFDDSGSPYRLKTLLRQRNPGHRVAGDKRYGAEHFMAGATASLWYTALWYPSVAGFYFDTDGRLNTNLNLYATGYGSCCNNDCSGTSCAGFANSGDAFCAFVQNFSVNPTTLQQTALSKAQDCIFGRNWTSTTPLWLTPAWVGYLFNGGFNSAFGADMAALDNGNFVAVAGDTTGVFGNAYPGVNSYNAFNCPVVTIFAPDGSIVKESWWMGDANVLWANVAACRGGFCIRVQDKIYFYDNAGNATHTNTVTASSGGMALDVTRGDYARIGSDIRSYYVYLASPNTQGGGTATAVNLAIWDSRTGAFVAGTNITADVPNFYGKPQNSCRAGVAVDALDRVCVAYHGSPDVNAGFVKDQVMARVMHFDGTKINFLTPTFFPFLNSDTNSAAVLNYEHRYPNVSMTTEAICIAARGIINSTNNPAGGPDVKDNTTFYTVISHPAPVAAPRPQMTVSKSGSFFDIYWNADAGLFTLQSSSSVAPASWSNVSPQPATVSSGSNYEMSVALGSGPMFFRLVR